MDTANATHIPCRKFNDVQILKPNVGRPLLVIDGLTYTYHKHVKNGEVWSCRKQPSCEDIFVTLLYTEDGYYILKENDNATSTQKADKPAEVNNSRSAFSSAEVQDGPVMEEHKRRVTYTQLEHLWKFVNAHKDVALGPKNTTQSRTQARKAWEKITWELNAIGKYPGGATKDWKGWTKYWVDYKSKLKKRKEQCTASQLNVDSMFSDLEKKYLDLIETDTHVASKSQTGSTNYFEEFSLGLEECGIPILDDDESSSTQNQRLTSHTRYMSNTDSSWQASATRRRSNDKPSMSPSPIQRSSRNSSMSVSPQRRRADERRSASQSPKYQLRNRNPYQSSMKLRGSPVSSNKENRLNEHKRRVSYDQLQRMWELLSAQKDVALGYNKRTEDRELARKLWERITTELNAIGRDLGCITKDSKGWARYWVDYKSKIKRKAQQFGTTDCNNADGLGLSELEKKYYDLIFKENHNASGSQIDSLVNEIEEFTLGYEDAKSLIQQSETENGTTCQLNAHRRHRRYLSDTDGRLLSISRRRLSSKSPTLSNNDDNCQPDNWQLTDKDRRSDRDKRSMSPSPVQRSSRNSSMSVSPHRRRADERRSASQSPKYLLRSASRNHYETTMRLRGLTGSPIPDRKLDNPPVRQSVLHAQLKRLYDLLSTHKDVALGCNRSAIDRVQARKFWETIAAELNAIGKRCGVTKDWKGWSEYWIDYKAKLKRKYQRLYSSEHNADGASSPDSAADDMGMSDMQKMFLELIDEELMLDNCDSSGTHGDTLTNVNAKFTSNLEDTKSGILHAAIENNSKCQANSNRQKSPTHRRLMAEIKATLRTSQRSSNKYQCSASRKRSISRSPNRKRSASRSPQYRRSSVKRRRHSPSPSYRRQRSPTRSPKRIDNRRFVSRSPKPIDHRRFVSRSPKPIDHRRFVSRSPKPIDHRPVSPSPKCRWRSNCRRRSTSPQHQCSSRRKSPDSRRKSPEIRRKSPEIRRKSPETNCRRSRVDEFRRQGAKRHFFDDKRRNDELHAIRQTLVHMLKIFKEILEKIDTLG